MSREMTAGDAYAAAAAQARRAWIWLQGPGQRIATAVAIGAAHQARRNLTPRRLLSFPHFLVGVWIIILLWGERWVFDSKVETCSWDHWEKWPKGTHPHRLVFVADPQITDPHSYPGRPWPLSSLTVTITDNYLRRGYKAMQKQLHPDSVFFLGDLFDGGREWKTKEGFVDPKWGRQRSKDEKKWIKTWHRKYGEDYWAREYQRFASIFFDNFNLGGGVPGPWQRGRRLVASLPGNHDLGFGAQVQVPVRDRFEAYFGDTNRVDVVGNHTIVSVDTVSLSADTSEYNAGHDLTPIYGPANKFLEGVQATKRKLVQDELRVWHGMDREMRFGHAVEELETADTSQWLRDADPGPGTAEFPTILLTHVPLYRDPGTPCGPMREHWPPTKPPKGQPGPVTPDERNAITVAAGYQYQNVLNEEDSVKLIKSVGNVVQVFSGDDHDYCELVHSKSKGNVREITVKSMGMNMGVKSPGFLMLSMYNPVGPDGKPIPGAPEQTLQTHMCLLPNSFRTYMKYIFFVIFSLALLAVRALLVPVLHLEPFALAPEQGPSLLPVYKDKADPPDAAAMRNGSALGSSSNRLNASAMPVSRSTSSSSNGSSRWAAKKSKGARRWGWGDESGPRISLDNDFYEDRKAWKAGQGKQAIGAIGRELWTTTWRVAWMVCLFWAYLARKG